MIGGQPSEEDLVMWSNFVGQTYDFVEATRADWQGGLTAPRFGHLDQIAALPGPEMPSVRLKGRPSGSAKIITASEKFSRVPKTET